MARVCTKCREEKDVAQFSRDSGGKDGLFRWCKACVSVNNRKYHRANAEKLKARAIARYDRQKQAARRAARAEHYAAYSAEWHAARKEQRNAAARERYRANKAAAQDRVVKRRAIKKGAKAGIVRRTEIWARDSGTCYYCKGPCEPGSWHLAHIVALCRGGPHSPENVAVSHPLCNWRAGRH